jgi:hypothetical protein
VGPFLQQCFLEAKGPSYFLEVKLSCHVREDVADMFVSSELGHKIDRATYDKKVPKLREARLDAKALRF